MIERALYDNLLAWKANPRRKPLLLRGARQVGKTSLVDAFGASEFDTYININFELQPDYAGCFSNLDPAEVCNSISVVSEQKIVPGRTLLFLDEIQDCPDAIRALRYFKETMSELHVIGAGSLLELALNEAEYRMPVGRVSSLYLRPLSFKEFLKAINPGAAEALTKACVAKPLSVTVHQYLLKQLKTYLFLGGMPEAVSAYKEDQSLLDIQAIHADIISTYEKDFGHYAKRMQVHTLRKCFHQVPHLVGRQIKYNKLDPDIRSRELKVALEKLREAHLIQPVFASTGSGIPLDATKNAKQFKLNFLDVGLVARISRVDSQLVLEEDVMLLNQGALAEQYVGQELSAYAENFELSNLYFWVKGGHSIAEVDYLYVYGGHVLPIEVKSGKSGRLRSLQQFMKERKPPLGIRISQLPLQQEEELLSVPLYMVSELDRLLAEVL